MTVPGKIRKKVPLPWSAPRRQAGDHGEEKLELALRSKFVEMFGERWNISTGERKEWADFLLSHGILWQFNSRGMPRAGWIAEGHTLRPDMENPVRVANYYIPRETAKKMLLLGGLP